VDQPESLVVAVFVAELELAVVVAGLGLAAAVAVLVVELAVAEETAFYCVVVVVGWP
jgi:hypothetical protein